MSLDDLNREQKRMLKRQGAIDEKGAPTRAVRQARRSGSGPLSTCARFATRCARWPGRRRPEVVRYSIIVTVCVIVYMIFVGGIDFGLSQVADWFYA